MKEDDLMIDRKGNVIHKSFEHGRNLRIGCYVIIEEDVKVGNNVKIGHRVTLKAGTRILDNSVIDDHCITTGACFVGNYVNVRTGAIISKATIIEDCCFIGPGVVTNHTKHVNHAREDKRELQQLVTYIGFGSVIGSQASIVAGVTIRPMTIIGAGSVVAKSIPAMSIGLGCPCVFKRSVPSWFLISDPPSNMGRMYREEVHRLKMYIPNLQIEAED